MKTSLILTLFSVVVAFAAGYLSLQLSERADAPTTLSQQRVDLIKRKFRENHKVISEIDLSTNLNNSQNELFKPSAAVASLRNYSFAQLSSINRAQSSCEPSLISHESLKKSRTWVSFVCGKIHQLPQNFFEQPPFLFPTGQSFASLAFNLSDAKFKSPEWIAQHSRYFHVLELKELPQESLAGQTQKVLSQLDADTISAFSEKLPWILSDELIFVKKGVELAGGVTEEISTNSYFTYNRHDFDAFINTKGLIIAQNKSNVSCAYSDSGLCWTFLPVTAGKAIRWSIGAILVIAIALALFSILQVWRTIKSHRFEEERKRFALQILTHELRTPISSLIISSEQIMKKLDLLPNEFKDKFLRMSDDVHRLRRLAETSRNYLTTEDNKQLIQFNYTKTPSIAGFVESVVERFLDQITIVKPENDRPFYLDEYWVGICLQNLVQNALQHGQKPVEVKSTIEKSYLVLSIQDSGNTLGTTSARAGLGLGLSIVQTVTKAMNAKLSVSKAPTRFELRIKEVT